MPIVAILNLYRSTDAIIMHRLAKGGHVLNIILKILYQIFPQNYIKKILFNTFHEFLELYNVNEVLKYNFFAKN